MKGWSSKTSSVLGCSRMSQRGGPKGEETYSESRWAALFLCQPCRSTLPTINRPVILHTRCFIYLDHDWREKKKKQLLCMPESLIMNSLYTKPSLPRLVRATGLICFPSCILIQVWVNGFRLKKFFCKPIIKLGQPWDFTGGSVAKTPYSQSWGPLFNP